MNRLSICATIHLKLETNFIIELNSVLAIAMGIMVISRRVLGKIKDKIND
jgi:hypothetical protein